MLYPLSYEGASPQPTCQRVSTSTRACQPLPTCLTSRHADPWSKKGAPTTARSARTNRCQTLHTAAGQ